MGGLARLLIPLLLANMTLSQTVLRDYTFVGLSKTWSDARSYCRSAYHDLAKTSTQEEWGRVLDIFSSSGFSHVWLGYTMGSISDCISSHYSSSWHTLSCATLQPFICMIERKVYFYNHLRIVMKTSGSLNLNDPHLRDALLTQMEKGVRAQGIQQPFHFRWKKQRNGKIFNGKDDAPCGKTC